MRESFNGWRRKVGCITLLLCVLLITTWIRSLVIGDRIWVPAGNRLHEVISADGMLYWWAYSETPQPASPKWDAMTFSTPRQGMKALGNHRVFHQKLAGSGFAEWTVPYWSIATPLVLLSAYLILVKPQRKK